MGNPQKIKFRNVEDFLSHLPEEELKIVEVLREIVQECIPGVQEKLSYNVPYYYRHSRVCYIWPSSVPWGGIKEGVCFGFVRGKLMSNVEPGEHKDISKQVFLHLKEIDVELLKEQIFEAVVLDEEIAQEKKKGGG